MYKYLDGEVVEAGLLPLLGIGVFAHDPLADGGQRYPVLVVETAHRLGKNKKQKKRAYEMYTKRTRRRSKRKRKRARTRKYTRRISVPGDFPIGKQLVFPIRKQIMATVSYRRPLILGGRKKSMSHFGCYIFPIISLSHTHTHIPS